MEITANAIQTVQAGSNILFNTTPVGGSASIIHRDGSGIVNLRGVTTTQDRARFKILFGANVALPEDTTPITPISFAIAINGEPIQTSAMVSTPAGANQYNNIFGALYLDVPSGCCAQIAVQNLSSTSAEVQGANLIVERVA